MNDEKAMAPALSVFKSEEIASFLSEKIKDQIKSTVREEIEKIILPALRSEFVNRVDFENGFCGMEFRRKIKSALLDMIPDSWGFNAATYDGRQTMLSMWRKIDKALQDVRTLNMPAHTILDQEDLEELIRIKRKKQCDANGGDLITTTTHG